MPNRLPRIITREQAAAMLAVPNTKTAHGLRKRVIMETLYRAGLRASELVDLKAVDVHIDELRIDVRDGKGGKSRAIPIGDTLAGWLRSWTLVRPNSEWFFCALYGRGYDVKAGKQLHTNYLRDTINRIALQVGIDPKTVSPHVFRHTYATEMLEDGFNLREIGLLLGHASVETTAIYLHVKLDEVAAKIKARDEEQTELAEDVAEKLEKLDADQLRALRGVLKGL